jgi:GDP-L-fucose synthase
MMDRKRKVYVAGHRGLVGGAICRELVAQGFENILTYEHRKLDLRNQAEVTQMMRRERPDYVFLCAAKVGGIVAHLDSPADFLVDNLFIQSNVMQAAKQYGTEKLLFLGSACAYPKFAPTPIKEEYLLTGELEPSNRGYALAKIADIEACKAYRKQHNCDFISCMPTNLYGPGDNYHSKNSHVIPGMLRKIHEAAQEIDGKPVWLWGTGSPIREFLYSEDMARACIFLMDHYSEGELINLGSGEHVTLRELAKSIANVVGFRGEILWDISTPDGTPARWLDNSKLFKLGWRPTVKLEAGLKKAYEDFLCQVRS